MKLTLNTESTSLLILAKELSGLNFNNLLKEAMELLVEKHKDQHDLFTKTIKPSNSQNKP
jgi:hypothetical protein